MKDKVCRVIKIDKEAIFQLIYEYFITEEEALLDIENKVGTSNHFDINWETGEFIFLAHKSEDKDENTILLPEDIDIKKLMSKIPTTTDSVLNNGRKYKEYTFDELSDLMKENK